MKPGVLIIVILFLVVGSMLGWHAQRAHSAHGDIKVTKKGRLPSFRKTRNRSGLWVVGIVVVLLLVMSALIRH
jgi:hypothetical protein